jgi:hypothetical protein
MEEDNIHKDNEPQSEGVPIPVVKLNRWILVIGIVSGLILQQPLVTTVLFFILLPTALFGRRWSLIAHIGKLIFAKQIPHAEREDFRLARFNNTIAAVLLGGAQVAFLLKAPIVGWVLSLMVAVAAGVALAGFCVGCFLYFQFKMQRYRFLGR